MAEERSPYQSTTEALDSPVKAADEKEEGGLNASISLFGGIVDSPVKAADEKEEGGLNASISLFGGIVDSPVKAADEKEEGGLKASISLFGGIVDSPVKAADEKEEGGLKASISLFGGIVDSPVKAADEKEEGGLKASISLFGGIVDSPVKAADEKEEGGLKASISLFGGIVDSPVKAADEKEEGGLKASISLFGGIVDSPVKAADEEKEEGGLKASISLFGGIMVIVGCIIGSGIFISPKGVHANAGSLGFSMVIWVFCGVFSAIGAYCYAELGTFIRQSGGDYAYVLVAFGELMGFLRLWIECIIVRPCTMTVMAMTFALYILRAIFPHCDPPPKAAQLLACGCLLVLTLVNCLSLKLVTGIQNVFTLAKLIALALIIFTGIVLLFIGGEYLENFEYPWSGTSTDPGRISMAFYSGLWAYNGWNYLNFVTEELENPVRNLPIAIAVSCTLCTIVYALTNIGFYAGVDLDQYLDSSAVAITFANRFYGKMAWIMPIFVAMSCFGAVNGVLLSSSRLFFVAGRQSHMPYLLSMINPYRETPIPAVFFTGFLACLYLTLSDNVYTLINYVQIVNWLAIGIATAGLLWLRRKMPPSKYERPLQVNIVFPIIFLLGCLFLVIFPIVDQPIDTAIGLAIMFSGVPAYYLFVWWQNKPAGFNRAMDKFTLFSQKLMLVAPIKKKD